MEARELLGLGVGVLLSTAKGLRQAAVALPGAGRRGRAGGTYTTDRESSAGRFPVTGLPPPFLLPLEFKAVYWAPVPSLQPAFPIPTSPYLFQPHPPPLSPPQALNLRHFYQLLHTTQPPALATRCH